MFLLAGGNRALFSCGWGWGEVGVGCNDVHLKLTTQFFATVMMGGDGVDIQGIDDIDGSACNAPGVSVTFVGVSITALLAAFHGRLPLRV